MIVYIQDTGRALNPTHVAVQRALANEGIRFRLFNFFFFPVRSGVVYLHYPDAYLGASTPLIMLIKNFGFAFSMILSRALGCRIIWEVNNLITHEHKYPRLERMLKKILVAWVDGTIHYSKTSLDDAQKMYPRLAKIPSRVIPHPNFLHLYPRQGDRERGHRILGVPNSQFNILCFGIIRRYKGIDLLLRAFADLKRKDVALIVAGLPLDAPYVKELVALAEEDHRVHLVLREFDDQELLDCYAASDLVCAPFRAILNSGSVMLALSLGRPVLAPRLGSLRDLETQVGPEWISLYDSLDSETLNVALKRALSRGKGSPDLSFCDIADVAADIRDFIRAVYVSAPHAQAIASTSVPEQEKDHF